MRCRIKVAFGSDIISPVPGAEVDVPPEYVRDWVHCGYAENLEPFPTPPPSSDAPVETAALAGAPETAVGKRQRK